MSNNDYFINPGEKYRRVRRSAVGTTEPLEKPLARAQVGVFSTTEAGFGEQEEQTGVLGSDRIERECSDVARDVVT